MQVSFTPSIQIVSLYLLTRHALRLWDLFGLHELTARRGFSVVFWETRSTSGFGTDDWKKESIGGGQVSVTLSCGMLASSAGKLTHL